MGSCGSGGRAGSVLEQDTESQIIPDEQLAPCMAASAISVWMCVCKWMNVASAIKKKSDESTDWQLTKFEVLKSWWDKKPFPTCLYISGFSHKSKMISFGLFHCAYRLAHWLQTFDCLASALSGYLTSSLCVLLSLLGLLRKSLLSK